MPGGDAPSKASFWYDPKVRAVFYQIGALAMVGMLAYYLMSNTMANLERSSANLESLTARFDRMLVRHEDDLGRFLEEGLGEAPELMRETRQTLRDLEKLAAELRDDPSQLVHRPPAESLDIDP